MILPEVMGGEREGRASAPHRDPESRSAWPPPRCRRVVKDPHGARWRRCR